MSWLFSQALGVEFSAATCSDGAQYAQLNVMPTPHKFWRNDKMMEFSRLSRFGLTCAVLTESHGAELLTWYLAGFHAKTSAQQEKEKEFQEKGAECGSTWRALLAKYDPGTHTWKTAQCSLLADSELFSGTWPSSGMVVNGEFFTLPPSALSIYDRGYGYLPTPTAHNAKEGAYPAEYTRNTPTLATHAGGKINPEWTEWIMGWPLGWTDLKPLAMDKFREWQRQHSAS